MDKTNRDRMISEAETSDLPDTANDTYAPANDKGVSDLNQHVLDLLAPPDPTKDPYSPQYVGGKSPSASESDLAGAPLDPEES